MAILIQCSNCQRKLRVQDYLLGKSVKCPNCQFKFLAQAVDGSEPSQAPSPATSVPAAEAALADDPAARSSGQEMLQTPVVPPLSPPAVLPDPAIPALEVTEPASGPSTAPSARPRSGERIAAAPPAPAALPITPEETSPPTPASPQPFETPALYVLAVMAVIVLLATVLGCGLGWWVGAAVENAAAMSGTP